MTEKRIRLSKSKIGTFTSCPYNYKRKYIDGYKPKVMPPQLIKGIEIHEGIDVAVKASKTPEDFLTKIKEDKNYDKWKEHFNNTSGYQKIQELPLEHELEIYDEEHHVIGSIDRVQKHWNKKEKKYEIVVFDYKTGKVHDMKWYKFELYVYAWMLEKHHNIKVDKVGIMFTEHGVLDTIEYDRNKIDFVFKKFDNTRKKIAEYTEKGWFPKRKSGLCPWCSLYQEGLCEGNGTSLPK